MAILVQPNTKLPLLEDRHRALVLCCLKRLASVCDRASSVDDEGFSKADAYAGHFIASCDESLLTNELYLIGLEIVSRYRRQLSGSFNLDCLPGICSSIRELKSSRSAFITNRITYSNDRFDFYAPRKLTHADQVRIDLIVHNDKSTDPMIVRMPTPVGYRWSFSKDLAPILVSMISAEPNAYVVSTEAASALDDAAESIDLSTLIDTIDNGYIEFCDGRFLIKHYSYFEEYSELRNLIGEAISDVRGYSSSLSVALNNADEVGAISQLSKKFSLQISESTRHALDAINETLSLYDNAIPEVMVYGKVDSFMIKLSKYDSQHISLIKKTFSTAEREYLPETKEWKITRSSENLEKLTNILTNAGWFTTGNIQVSNI